MSTQLQVFRAKPNPIGKDKTSGGIPKPEQLLGEWVDFKNIGTESVPFSSMELSHALYGPRCEVTGRRESYWSGGGVNSLTPGEMLRIHTGQKAHESLMSPEDRGVVAARGFAERSNFVLNNQCGDVIAIAWHDGRGNRYSDTASYRANQPEGAILTRVGTELVSGMSAGR